MKCIYNEELGQFEITIPYRKGDHENYPHSKSGKSKTIASTKGTAHLTDGPDPMKLNLTMSFMIDDPKQWGPNLVAEKAATQLERKRQARIRARELAEAGEGGEPQPE